MRWSTASICGKSYYVKRYQDARKILEKRSEINPEKEGLISIQVSDRDPKRAADIANAWVDELRVLNQNLALTEAAQRRVFFEQKLAAEREDLSKAELALKLLQEKTGLIQPDAQARSLIGAVADFRAQVAAKQVQLQSLRTYATEDNPDVKRVERELAELQSQLAKLSQMERSGTDPGEGNLQVPTRRVPQANARIPARGARVESTTRLSMIFLASSWRPPASTSPRTRSWCRWSIGRWSRNENQVPSAF